MSKHNKNVHTFCAPKYLKSHKISYFFDFFSIFSNLLFTCVQNLWFPLPRALRVSERHTNLHAPCGHDYLRSHKISDFFDFFAIFFKFTVHLVHCSRVVKTGLTQQQQGRKVTGFESSGCTLSGFRVEGRKLNSAKSWGTKNILFSIWIHN